MPSWGDLLSEIRETANNIALLVQNGDLTAADSPFDVVTSQILETLRRANGALRHFVCEQMDAIG